MVRPEGEVSPLKIFTLNRIGEDDLAERLVLESSKSQEIVDEASEVYSAEEQHELRLATEQRALIRSKLPQVLELAFCRVADELMVFLIDLLSECLSAKPDALRAFGRSYTLADIEAFDSIASFRDHVRRDVCYSLSRLSLPELCREIKGKMGFRLFEDDDPRTVVEALIQRRNSFVHERGVVTGEKSTSLREPAGTQLIETEASFYAHRDVILMWAFRVDVRAEQRFGLEILPISDRPTSK